MRSTPSMTLTIAAGEGARMTVRSNRSRKDRLPGSGNVSFVSVAWVSFESFIAIRGVMGSKPVQLLDNFIGGVSPRRTRIAGQRGILFQDRSQGHPCAR